MSLASPLAEQIIIGCCLQGQDLSDEVVGLRAEHFAGEAHRAAFVEILKAWERGTPLDAVSLDDILRTRIPQVGDLTYWVECVESGYSLAMLPAHVSTVKAKALRRALMEAANKIAALAHDEGNVREHIASAAALVDGLLDGTVMKGPRIVSDLLRECVPAIQERWDGVQSGLTTGFVDLDRRIRLRPGNLVLVAARPAMGKTSFAMQIAAGVARHGTVVAFSQEMVDSELMDRLIALHGRVSLGKVINGGMVDEDFNRFSHGIREVNDLRLWVDDSPAQKLSDIRAKVQQVRRREKIDLVVIDYLQLMSGDGENRNSEVEKISRGLKAMAKEIDCPVIALSQLNRSCEQRPNKRPMLSDLRDSGAIEQDADVVLMIYRDEVYNPDSPDAGTAEILIRKNRQGQTGEVRLAWLGDYTAFGNCDYQERKQTAQRVKPFARGFDE